MKSNPIKYLIVSATIFVVSCGRPFSGDGTLVDHGMFSYPRYIISFAPFSLDSGKADLEFAVTGVPTDRMTFGFALPAASGSNTRERLTKATNVSVTITIRRNNATLNSIQSSLDGFVFAQSDREILIWTPSLRDIEFNSASRYSITVQIASVGGGIPGVVLQPRLLGGGSELP